MNPTFLMDGDKNSCLDDSGIISPTDDLYHVLLQMTVKDIDDLTGTESQVNVVFNQAIVCSTRQV